MALSTNGGFATQSSTYISSATPEITSTACGLCLSAVSPVSQCEGVDASTPNCEGVQPLDTCEGDRECGTNNELNNCPGDYDVYQRVECSCGSFSASYGIDGSTSSYNPYTYPCRMITQTSTQSNPWWQVELDDPHDITRVVIHSQDLLSNAKVSILDENDNIVAAKTLGNTANNATITLDDWSIPPIDSLPSPSEVEECSAGILQQGNYTDEYYIRLTRKPLDGTTVEIDVTSVAVATDKDGLFTPPNRNFTDRTQVYVNGSETTSLIFTSANWSEEVLLVVTAIDDDVEEGVDLLHFAPQPSNLVSLRQAFCQPVDSSGCSWAPDSDHDPNKPHDCEI